MCIIGKIWAFFSKRKNGLVNCLDFFLFYTFITRISIIYANVFLYFYSLIHLMLKFGNKLVTQLNDNDSHALSKVK